MQRITLEVSDGAYQRIIDFLRKMPDDLVRIYKEPPLHQKKTFCPRDFFGLAKSTKEEVDRYLKNIRSEWENIIEK